MRNLKKVLAVIMTVAMIASLMVPALAAGSNEDEAEALKTIGLFKGTNSGNALESTLTRDQGITLVVRILGKEDEALALSEEEISTQLAKMADAAAIPGWARPYAAFALKEKITTGVGHNGVTSFDAATPLSGKLFTTLVLRALGYVDVDYNNPWDTAVDAGVLTAGQTITLAKESIIRDDAVAALYGAVKNGVLADGKTKLLDKLIADGAVDKDAAREAGFITEPEKLEVEDVKALNLKQIVVEFNKEVTDDDTIDAIKDEDNYKLRDSDDDKVDVIDSVSFDENIATITLKEKADANGHGLAVVENQEDYSLEISDSILDKDTTFDFSFADKSFPTAESAEVIGIDTIKVNFSEPIKPYTFAKNGSDYDLAKPQLDKKDFKVNNGDLNVKRVELVNNNTEANIILYSDLKDGDKLSVKVNGSVEDYAGYSVLSEVFDLVVAEDDEAPYVVGFKDADKDEVTLIFNEDIKFVDSNPELKDFYHTNTRNYAKSVAIDGKELTIKFEVDDENEANYAPLPGGTVYVFVKAEAIQDYWENENEKITAKVEVTEDLDKPEVKSVEQGDSQKELVVTFSEDVTKKTAEDKGNYIVKDSDGDKVYISKAELTDSDEVTLTMRNALEDGEEYTVFIEDVEDQSGNVMNDAEFAIVIEDKTAVAKGDISAKAYDLGGDDQRIIVDFGEDMTVGSDKYAVDDIDKYVLTIDGTTKYNVSDLYDAEIGAIDNNTAVEISLPCVTGKTKSIDFTGKTLTLTIAKFADAAGNVIDSLYYDEISVTTANTVAYDSKPKATDLDTITFSFKDKLDIESEDFKVIANTTATTAGATELDISKFSTGKNSKGNTTVTITLDKDLDYLAQYGGKTVYVLITDDPKSENENGTTITAGLETVADGIAPAVAQDDGDKDLVTVINDTAAEKATIILEFEEAIKADSVSKLSFETEDYTVDAIYVNSAKPSTVGGAHTSTDGKYVVIELSEVDDEGGVLEGFVINQRYAITDLEGNEVDDISTEVLSVEP